MIEPYRVAEAQNRGPWQPQDKAYECGFCDGYGWLGYSRQEMCQVCEGRKRVIAPPHQKSKATK